MLTIFSTPKPFVGHIDVIQRNAIESWKRLHEDVEVILLGDDAGTAEACAELGIRHIKEVKRNAHGTKYLASIYDQAQEAARHGVLCHVNCDIVLMADFLRAAKVVLGASDQFLMAGQRWDVDVKEPLEFAKAGWEKGLEQLARKTNRQRPPQWIDYFLFSKGLYYGKIPEFVIGRPGWDNWLLWHAVQAGVPVVDASRAVVAVHQNHDYGYHPDGEEGVWQGEEAQENYRLHEGKYETLAGATHILAGERLTRNYRRGLAKMRNKCVGWFYDVWFALLKATRPVRHRLGWRSSS